MDLRDIALACVRRWYVFLLVVVLFGVVLIDQRAQARPAYQVDTLFAVVPTPSLAEVRDGASGADRVGDTNPFGSPATVALYLAELVQAQVDQAQVDQNQVQVSWSGLEPTLVRVLVTAADAPSAAALGTSTSDALRSSLAAVQDGQVVSPADRFVLLATSDQVEVMRVVPAVRQLTAVIAASGMLAAATVATALDSVLRRRRAASSRARADHQSHVLERSPA